MGVSSRAWDLLPQYVRDSDTALGHPLRRWLSGPLDQETDAELAIASSSDLGDPALAPREWLEWLAALGGVDLTAVPQQQTRAYLISAATHARGSVAAIQSRCGLTLTGSRTVDVTTHYLGDPNRVQVAMYTTEVPDTDVSTAAAKVECPAWLELTVTYLTGMPYSTMAGRYTPYSVMTATGKTYATLTSEV